MVAVAVQSAGNLFFHGLSGRWLSPDEYGALGVLLAATTALAVPLGALQAAASHVVARDGSATATAHRLITRTALIAGGLALLLVPLAPACAGWWHLAHWTDVLPVPAYAVVAAVVAVVRGLLLGTGAIRPVAGTFVIGTAARLVTGIALTPTLGVLGALLATLLGEIASLVLGLRAVRRHCTDPGEAARLDLADTLRPLAAVSGLFLLSTVDLLLSRHYLTADASGAYVAAATLGKTVLALPAAVVSASYPRLVRSRTDPEPTARRTVLRHAVRLTCGSAGLVAAVGIVAPQLLLRLLYGDVYADQATLLRTLLAIAAATSLVSVLTYAGLARHGRTAWLPWVAAIVEIGLISVWHQTPLSIALSSAAATLLAVVALSVTELPRWSVGSPDANGSRTE